jgi:formate hydrogenlyase subunit 6/NADH:ubiquinone oxidoreductase subunit I
MTVSVASSCTACGLCVVTCPTNALVRAPHRPSVVGARCTDCWLCLEVCPVDAIVPSRDPGARSEEAEVMETGDRAR